ncbi:MAG TPA: hypothetical protein EYP55_02705, partial [Anaerolineae bacterium]|nr:hypothetical protein [Anaerolineae bacterium]
MTERFSKKALLLPLFLIACLALLALSRSPGGAPPDALAAPVRPDAAPPICGPARGVPASSTQVFCPDPVCEVVIADHHLQPSELIILVGTTVRWINRTGTAHYICDANLPRTWCAEPRPIPPWGGTGEHLFNAPGEYPYVSVSNPDIYGFVYVLRPTPTPTPTPTDTATPTP